MVSVGPVDALTGPVVRGDAGVLTRHLEALEQLRPESRALYVELVRALGRIGREGSDAARLDPVAQSARALTRYLPGAGPGARTRPISSRLDL